MGILSLISKNIIYLASLLIVTAIAIIEIVTNSFPKWALITLLLLSAILTAIDKFWNESSLRELFTKVEVKLESDETKKEVIDKQIKYNEDWQTKKETALNLLNHLIEKSFIDREEISKPLDSSQIFALYCFPASPIISKDGKIKHSLNRRIYPNFLKKMGFIRLHVRRGLFYVIPKERLIPKLQNTFYLKQHILQEIEKTFPEEWDNFLKGLKRKKSLSEEYSHYKDKKYVEELKFNVLLLNTDISENNVGYLYGERTFTNEFHNFLNQQLDLKKLGLSKKVKINIRDYMKKVSLEFFFKGETQANIEKISEIEPDFKNHLNITNWEDYLNKSHKDILSAFKKMGFTEIRSNKYANLLIKRVSEYKEALRELRINL